MEVVDESKMFILGRLYDLYLLKSAPQDLRKSNRELKMAIFSVNKI